jgi:hypothetical protein
MEARKHAEDDVEAHHRHFLVLKEAGGAKEIFDLRMREGLDIEPDLLERDLVDGVFGDPAVFFDAEVEEGIYVLTPCVEVAGRSGEVEVPLHLLERDRAERGALVEVCDEVVDPFDNGTFRTDFDVLALLELDELDVCLSKKNDLGGAALSGERLVEYFVGADAERFEFR